MTDVRRQRIAFFDFVTQFGGGQAATVLLCEELRRCYDVHVIDAYGTCTRYVETVAAHGLPLEVLQPGARTVCIGQRGRPLARAAALGRQLPALWRLCRALRGVCHRLQPRLIWTNSAKALAFLWWSGVARRIPVAFYAHGWYRRTEVPWLRRWLIRRVPRGVLAVSSGTARALAEWGVPATRIHTVYNTLRLDGLREQAARGLLSALPAAEADVRIVVPGLVTRTKGQHTAIEAAGLLRRAGADLVVWIVGDCAVPGGSAYVEELKGLAGRSGVADRVFFLGWREDLAAIVAAATVVVFPSHTEGLPRVVAEAMLLNRPVVATPVGGMEDLIVPGVTGLVAPVDDPAAFAAQLRCLSAAPELAQEITAKARAHVSALLDTGRQVRLVQAAFERLMSS